MSTAALSAFTWAPFPDVSGIGVPGGCTLVPPVLATNLPKGTTRFVAPPGSSSELLVAVDEDGDRLVDQSGVLDPLGQSTEGTRWRKLAAPPFFARSSEGLLAFEAEDTGNRRRASLFRTSGAIETLVDGDQLEIVDTLCEGATCAVLTTLASASAGPGATLLIGDARAPASTWTRVDLPGENDNFTPFSIVRLHDGIVWAALTTRGAISVFRVEKGAFTALGRILTPFGAYDVVLGETPIVLAPGESIEHTCDRDGFVVRLLRTTGNGFEIEGHVPPSNVVTRALVNGFFVGWLAPMSCKQQGRNMVRAFLVNAEGAPASSTMAVAEATGFAVSAHADLVDLWLSTDKELIWVKARCALGSTK